MFRVLSAALLCCLAATAAQAQSFAEFEMRRAPDSWEPQVTAWVVSDLTPKKDALTVWALASRGWGEVLVGYQRTLTPWLTAGVGAGVETHPDAWRVNPWFFAERGKYSLFLTAEEGASDFWYRMEAGYKFSGKVTAGLFSRSSVGTGPYATVTVLPKTVLFGAVTLHDGDMQALVALRRSF